MAEHCALGLFKKNFPIPERHHYSLLPKVPKCINMKFNIGIRVRLSCRNKKGKHCLFIYTLAGDTGNRGACKERIPNLQTRRKH